MVKPAVFVTVHDDQGEAHTFSPEDDLPKWAVAQISNPAVLPDKHPQTGSTPVQRQSN